MERMGTKIKKKTRYQIYLISLIIIAIVVWLGISYSQPQVPKNFTVQDSPPKIRPDYDGVVIPANIAPLNFIIEELGFGYVVEIHSAKGSSITTGGNSPAIKIPLRQWRNL